MSVIEHLETFLGTMSGGWGSASGPEGVQVASFRDQPVAGVETLATLGLSHHTLDLPSKFIRQELLFGFHQHRSDEGDLAMMLLSVAEELLSTHRAPLRGEIIPLGFPVVKGSRMRDLYVSMPSAFPDGIDTYSVTIPPTVIVWLFPILPTETEWIHSKGWSSFEDELERIDPDLFDLMRDSIIQH